MANHRDRITLVEGDGVAVLREHRDTRACAGFIDPPYTAEADGGPGRHHREHRLDHADLFQVLAVEMRKHAAPCKSAATVAALRKLYRTEP